jgi:hypothetical protein
MNIQKQMEKHVFNISNLMDYDAEEAADNDSLEIALTDIDVSITAVTVAIKQTIADIKFKFTENPIEADVSTLERLNYTMKTLLETREFLQAQLNGFKKVEFELRKPKKIILLPDCILHETEA